MEGHTSWIKIVSTTNDGRRVVSAGGWDNTLRVWDLETGECLHALEGHTAPVNSVSLTPDSRHAVSASDDKTLRVWDLEAGVCLHALEGHTDSVNSVSVTPDGQGIVSVSDDRTLRAWDLYSGTCLAIARLSVPVAALALSAVLGRVIVGTSSGEIIQFDLVRGGSRAACGR